MNLSHDAKTYLLLKSVVESVTGFNIPEVAPPVGRQINIPLPNGTDKENRAILVYLGGEQLRLLSKDTKEDYIFNGVDRDYQDYRNKAQAIRLNEIIEQVKWMYQAAESVTLSTEPLLLEAGYKVPVLTGVLGGHDDYFPNGVTAGALRKHKEAILQPFYSPKGQDERGPVEPKLTAVRSLLADDLQGEIFGAIPPSLHIHRLAHGMPVVWVCGYENAIAALKRFPDFTVKEALSLVHLLKFVGRGRGDEIARQAGTLKDCYLALTLEQIKQFNLLVDADKAGSSLVPFREVEHSFIQLGKGECFDDK
ncbi:hypothetical protein [Thiomicrorhabdus xiamenensis]|uniref:Uncharacterized protein n=1 Tax=Thiomicrorhabdus xiamenensis TaxID=2739063 RepID=A0A7D4NSF8_9GAMM|nr:hypothetical protein [Thiomicrorhabdus xiamenensis]QKI89917.1 hypothetical protein HQN79_10190 [Thiomicrorhabdus xiamenensis]